MTEEVDGEGEAETETATVTGEEPFTNIPEGYSLYY